MHAALFSVLQLLTTTTQLLWNVLHFFYLIMLRFEHGLNAVTFKGKMSVRFAVQIKKTARFSDMRPPYNRPPSYIKFLDRTRVTLEVLKY